ncbi:hypothetical protein NU08_0466 [Flavobacterium anhuiense]|uniref:Uncharacterized protein n=1 Tax=Flavobacterium anhuiense TaxID=459526 RepID=A0A444W581_9FLAO|nr:hypothetical protein NU08_0466 [Flavobacterium anhuiense]
MIMIWFCHRFNRLKGFFLPRITRISVTYFKKIICENLCNSW